MKTQYLHSSMAGSYWIECDILAKSDTQYYIRYFDIVIEEYVSCWEDKQHVQTVQ